MRIKVGTLVMWTKQHHILDKGSVGLVTFLFERNVHSPDEGVRFKVLWNNGRLKEYSTDGQALKMELLKVVKF